MLMLEATGPEGERLAMAAADAAGVAVGWDAELNTATFDSDDLEIRSAVFAALDGIDPEWRAQLSEVE